MMVQRGPLDFIARSVVFQPSGLSDGRVAGNRRFELGRRSTRLRYDREGIYPGREPHLLRRLYRPRRPELTATLTVQRKRNMRIQKTIRVILIVSAFATSLTLAGAASSQVIVDTPGAVEDAIDIPVTVDNFVRAATDFEFRKYASVAGGVNKFFHFREPTPIDNQPTIRMNRDTLYSIGHRRHQRGGDINPARHGRAIHDGNDRQPGSLHQ